MKHEDFEDIAEELYYLLKDYLAVESVQAIEFCEETLVRRAKDLIAAYEEDEDEEDTPKKSEMPCNRCKRDVPETTIGKAFDDIINAVSTLADEVETLIEEKEKKNVQN